MFFLATIVFAFFPAFVSCKHFGKAPYFQNPLTSLLLQDKGFADLTGLKPVPTHPSHPQYKTAEEGTGWMYTYVYNGTDCDPNKAAVEYGMVTDQCFTASHSTQNSSLTVMITCFEDEAVTLFYNSTDCNPETSWGPDWLELNTCFQFNSSVDGSGLYGLDSFEIFCVQDSTLPVSGGEWVILSSYAEDNCTDIYSFNAFLDNVCYQFPYEAFRFNYPNETYYNTTDRAYEYSVDCSNSYHSRVHELPTTCYNDYETGDDEVVQIESNIASFYYSPANFTSVPTSYPTPIPTSYSTPIPTSYPTSIPTSYPTATPTAKTMVTAYPTEIPTTEPTFQSTAVPTVAATAKTTSVPSPIPSTDPTTQPTAVPTTTPTVQPTAVPTRVPTTQGTLAPTLAPTSSPTFPAYLIFTSNITLSGVSSTSLDQASQQAVVNTTAISMNIPNNQVSFVSAYSVPSSSPVSVSVSAAAVRGHTRGGKVHFTASSSIVAITKVKAPLSDPSQSTALYTQLTSALNQSVSSNEFSETLQSLSKATGATQTMNANATGVWSSAATVSSVATSSSSSSNDDGLSGGAIAGIVIGVVAFMALMLGGGYYLYAKKNSQSSGSSNNVTNEAPAVTIMMKSNPTSSPPDEFAGVSPMQQSSLPPPVVAVAIEEGLPDSQKTKQLKQFLVSAFDAILFYFPVFTVLTLPSVILFSVTFFRLYNI